MKEKIIKGHKFNVYDGDCESIRKEYPWVNDMNYFNPLIDKAFKLDDMDLKIAMISHKLIAGFELKSEGVDYHSPEISEFYQLFHDGVLSRPSAFTIHVDHMRKQQSKKSFDTTTKITKKSKSPKLVSKGNRIEQYLGKENSENGSMSYVARENKKRKVELGERSANAFSQRVK